MSYDLSPIKNLLSFEYEARLHRNVFILSGENEWQKESLKSILSGYEKNSLWVGEYDPGITPFVETKKSRGWLGNEKRVVVFDANESFDPDSFAAISGIVIGGGIFFLLLPSKDKWASTYSSNFGQRLLKSITDNSNINVIYQNEKQFNFSLNKIETKPALKIPSPFLTYDQQKSVESIEKFLSNKTKTPIVLISDRGRGKSAALGIAIARAINSGIKNIAVTAPRLTSTNIIFKHIAEILPDSEIAKGSVKYAESSVQFYSPDNLIQDKIKADVLFVDEAAAIPIPILTSFLTNYPQCVFATTVHGYEGTGRGFSLRFFKELDKHDSSWVKLLMQTPIRWAENDPLETWTFDLLCLDAELVDDEIISKIKISDIEYCFINKKELVENPSLLKEVFSLLVLAHYRTRPKDLKNLLDDENISLYVAFYNKHAIAVSLVIQEGAFSASLSTEVYRGSRRLQGHLLAQALTYHCGVEQAATLNYSRIMRIAVHPEFQEQGIGSKLLEFIIQHEKKKGRDAIGTSFGLNMKLLSFWQAAEFNVVRIGFTREQTSGEHAAIMLRPLNHNGEIVYQQAYSRFLEQMPYWLDDILIDLPEEIKITFKTTSIEKNTELTELDYNDIYSFIHYSRNYELCISAINKLIMLKQKIINDDFSEKLKQIVNEKIIKKNNWKQISLEMLLGGKAVARQLFKTAIIQLMNKKIK